MCLYATFALLLGGSSLDNSCYQCSTHSQYATNNSKSNHPLYIQRKYIWYINISPLSSSTSYLETPFQWSTYSRHVLVCCWVQTWAVAGWIALLHHSYRAYNGPLQDSTNTLVASRVNPCRSLLSYPLSILLVPLCLIFNSPVNRVMPSTMSSPFLDLISPHA